MNCVHHAACKFRDSRVRRYLADFNRFRPIYGVGKKSFAVWIIPHTLEVTNLSARKAGDRVNLEFDMLAKYLERLVEGRKE